MRSDLNAISGVPHAVTRPDRIPSKRYYDPQFFALEQERLWSRVWQMACRLEEIPRPGDFAVYDILDQSVIVVRTDEQTIKAFHNHCRHRGMRLVSDRGRRPNGFVCPFHGWRYDLTGECAFVFEPDTYSRDLMNKADLKLREVRVDTWGGCAFINLDWDAPPLRDSLEPFATMHDAWKVEGLRTEWWLAAKLPVNWKLATEAFMEGYHVSATHPQLRPPGAGGGPGSRYVPIPEDRPSISRWVTAAAPKESTGPAGGDFVETGFTGQGGDVDSREFIDTQIRYMRLLSEGMGGMIHENDIKIAETLRNLSLPKDLNEASLAWRRALNDAVMDHYQKRGIDIPNLHHVDRDFRATGINWCFPNYCLLPTFGSAASYRVRPLGPEECLFEVWSLTRYSNEAARPPLKTPQPLSPDDPRWPAVTAQDFTNLPAQQRGLHSKEFEFMRLSKDVEGLISNFERLIDGYLAGLDYDTLVSAVHKVSNTIDVPIVDIGFGPRVQEPA